MSTREEFQSGFITKDKWDIPSVLHREDTAGISFGAERDITPVSLVSPLCALCFALEGKKKSTDITFESPSFDIDSLSLSLRLTENARKRDAKFNRAYMNYDSLYFP